MIENVYLYVHASPNKFSIGVNDTIKQHHPMESCKNYEYKCWEPTVTIDD